MNKLKRSSIPIVCLSILLLLGAQNSTNSDTDLKVEFREQGLGSLSYDSVPLLGPAPASCLVTHLKMSDLRGEVLHGGQFDWGCNNNGVQWDDHQHSWTYLYRWGQIEIKLQQVRNALYLEVAEHVNSDAGVILDGAVVEPFALQFAALPDGFLNQTDNHYSFGTEGPAVVVATVTGKRIITAAQYTGKPLYSGFQARGQNVYVPILASTTPDSIADFQPHFDRPVHPGETDHFGSSLRFGSENDDPYVLAADVYQHWREAFPQTLHWTDRRIIGSAFLASSAPGDSTRPAGYPNNPRRYFNNSDSGVFDVRTAEGLRIFQSKVLERADEIVKNMRDLNAQGTIVWDIEGEEFPMNTTYACSPDQVSRIAPEMESTVTDPSSRFFGNKLVDAFFATLRDSGFRVGVCVRPQHFLLNADGTAEQQALATDKIAGELIAKMRYSHERWGATLFYVDSSVYPSGAYIESEILKKAAQALPDVLLIPEETSLSGYANTAGFLTFLFHGDTGTPSEIKKLYPDGFSVNMINDVDPNRLAAHSKELTQSIQRGDILMVHSDEHHPNNDVVLGLYRDAANH